MKTKSYSVCVVEDEILPRELIIRYVVDRSELSLLAICKDGKEAMEKLVQQNFDLLITDIDLPYLSGIKIVEKLEYTPYVIFISSFDEYAIKAFEIGAVDYILKPVTEERFNKAIDRFLSFTKNQKKEETNPRKAGLSINEKSKYYFIPFDELLYISAHQKKSVLHTKERDYEASGLSKEIENKLSPDIFFRIHKQYIVNMELFSHVESMNKSWFVFLDDEDETCLPLGRKYFELFKEKMNLDI